jgi:hypothetical protein
VRFVALLRATSGSRVDAAVRRQTRSHGNWSACESWRSDSGFADVGVLDLGSRRWRVCLGGCVVIDADRAPPSHCGVRHC